MENTGELEGEVAIVVLKGSGTDLRVTSEFVVALLECFCMGCSVLIVSGGAGSKCVLLLSAGLPM